MAALTHGIRVIAPVRAMNTVGAMIGRVAVIAAEVATGARVKEYMIAKTIRHIGGMIQQWTTQCAIPEYRGKPMSLLELEKANLKER